VAAALPSPPARGGRGIADEIAKLGALAREGILTPEELDRAKEQLLGRPVDEATQTITMLRQLHALYRGKVLSESEFNMKKWELLTR
jgi:hypothetical protein